MFSVINQSLLVANLKKIFTKLFLLTKIYVNKSNSYLRQMLRESTFVLSPFLFD